MIEIELFRVPTYEILEELTLRAKIHHGANFTSYTSKELMEFVLKNRMTDFLNK